MVTHAYFAFQEMTWSKLITSSASLLLLLFSREYNGWECAEESTFSEGFVINHQISVIRCQWDWWRMWLLTEVVRWIRKCIGLYSLLRFSHFIMHNDHKNTMETTQDLKKTKKLEYYSMDQSPDLNPLGQLFSYCEQTEDRKTQDQAESECSCTEAWLSISRKETQNLVISIGSRHQAFTYCKRISSKYWKLYNSVSLSKLFGAPDPK